MTFCWTRPFRFASLLFFLALPAAVQAQAPPVADHHAHLQSPRAAQLLNEGAISPPGSAPRPEEAYAAKDLIAVLDAAGVRRAVALSDSYRLGSPFVHVPHQAEEVNAENDWTRSQAALYPNRLLGFCSVNPVRPYALAAIEHCVHIGLRGGLKLHLANARFKFDDPEQVRKLQQTMR